MDMPPKIEYKVIRFNKVGVLFKSKVENKRPKVSSLNSDAMFCIWIISLHIVEWTIYFETCFLCTKHLWAIVVYL